MLVSSSRGRSDASTERRPAAALGRRRVESVMGTIVTIDVRDAIDPGAVDAAIAYLHEIDARFSLWQSDSEMSRLARSELALEACHPDIIDVLGLCEDLRRDSDGAFDAQRHRTDGLLDPTAIVKGWSVDGAARILEAAGARSYAIGAGGDILARGEPEPGRPWRVGIQHPDRPDRVAAVLLVRDLAVATSGAYERGDHIVDPRQAGRPVEDAPRSVTVVGPTLTWADAYATTAFVMGEPGLAWVDRHRGFGALVITAADRVRWTAAIDPLIDRASTE